MIQGRADRGALSAAEAGRFRAPDDAAPLVEVRDLVKVYEPSPLWMRMLLRSAIDEPVTALRHLSFRVAPGEIVAVVGPNGAGKSTLFRILTGLTTPTDGTATVAGLDTTTQSRAVRRVVGFVPADDRSLYLRHTGRENLLFHGRLQGLPAKDLRERVSEVLDIVGLGATGDRVGFAMSAGMRARLQLARALLHDPRVLILDEPTASIDPVGSYRLLETIERVTAERRLGVLISSHRLEEIEALHDHALLLDRGALMYEGDLETLRRQWERPQIEIRFVRPEAATLAATRLARRRSVDVVSVDPPTLTLSTTMATGKLLGLLEGQVADIASVNERRISLRDLLARVADAPPQSLAGPSEGDRSA